MSIRYAKECQCCLAAWQQCLASEIAVGKWNGRRAVIVVSPVFVYEFAKSKDNRSKRHYLILLQSVVYRTQRPKRNITTTMITTMAWPGNEQQVRLSVSRNVPYPNQYSQLDATFSSSRKACFPDFLQTRCLVVFQSFQSDLMFVSILASMPRHRRPLPR